MNDDTRRRKLLDKYAQTHAEIEKITALLAKLTAARDELAEQILAGAPKPEQPETTESFVESRGGRVAINEVEKHFQCNHEHAYARLDYLARRAKRGTFKDGVFTLKGTSRDATQQAA